jgi:hypothetical protein
MAVLEAIGGLFCLTILGAIVFAIIVILILRWIFGTKVVVNQPVQYPQQPGQYPPGQPYKGHYCRYCGSLMGVGDQCPRCGRWN